MSGACASLPANGRYFGSGTTYTLTGAAFGTPLTANFNIAPLINTCQFACASGYGWNGSACVTYAIVCTGSGVTQTANKCTFNYLGAAQSIIVSGNFTLTVSAWGGGGGVYSGVGGGGAAATLSLPVIAGDNLGIYVGGGGGNATGGGATYVMKNTTPAVVAGGGGSGYFANGLPAIGYAGGSTGGGTAGGLGGGGGGYTSAGGGTA